MMIVVSEKLKIIGLVVEKTKESKRHVPAMRQLYLKLSTRPNAQWVGIFEGEREFARHNMWREAWIDGQYIVIDCLPEELESIHLVDLKQDVEVTNDKYFELVRRKSEEEQKKKIERDAERQRLEDLASKLNFD